MAQIACIETGLYRVPLPTVLTDSTHGEIRHFELLTARVRDSDGAGTAQARHRLRLGGAGGAARAAAGQSAIPSRVL